MCYSLGKQIKEETVIAYKQFWEDDNGQLFGLWTGEKVEDMEDWNQSNIYSARQMLDFPKENLGIKLEVADPGIPMKRGFCAYISPPHSWQGRYLTDYDIEGMTSKFSGKLYKVELRTNIYNGHITLDILGNPDIYIGQEMRIIEEVKTLNFKYFDLNL